MGQNCGEVAENLRARGKDRWGTLGEWISESKNFNE